MKGFITGGEQGFIMSKYLSAKIQSIAAYVPGEQPTDHRYVKLNTNESPFPPSPKVMEAISAAEISKLNLYPDLDGNELKQKLAQIDGVQAENISLCNGADEAITFAFIAFCDNNTGVAFPDVGYNFYQILAELFGVPYLPIPVQEDLSLDPQKFYWVNNNIFIANPNTPTGIALGIDQIERIVDANPNNVVVIDEAYIYFGSPSCVNLIQKYPNLLLIRTLSKSRFQAGLRVGYAIGSAELIADLEKVRKSINPYNLSRLSLLAAQAALDDNSYYMARCAKIAATREMTAKFMRQRGFILTPSKANFIFCRHPQLGGSQLYAGLKKRGILVRHFDSPPLSDYIGITIGTTVQMVQMIEAVSNILQEHRISIKA